MAIPDEADTEHPFSLAEAVARLARDDAEIARLLANRPDVYVGESQSQSRVDDLGRVSWHHWVVFTDGEMYRSRHIFTEPGLPPALAGLEAIAPADPRVTIEPWEEDVQDVTGIYPRPSQRTQQLPRVAEVLAAFLAAANETVRAQPVGWEVLHVCEDDCADPVTIMRVNAVSESVPLTAVSEAVEPRGYAKAALNVREDGSVLSHAKRTNTPNSPGLLALAAGSHPVERSSARVAPAPTGLPYAPIAAVAGGLALAALAAWLVATAKAAGLGGGAGLFSRIEDSRLLEHKGRAALVQAIEAEPGVHLRELARRTGQAEGALRHHLRKLEAAGLVVAKPLGGYLCYFVPGAASAAGAGASAAARSEGARKVLAALQAGAVGVRGIAAATGLAPSTVSHHLGRLREAGALPAGVPDGAGQGEPASAKA